MNVQIGTLIRKACSTIYSLASIKRKISYVHIRPGIPFSPLPIRHMVAKRVGGARLKYCPKLNSDIIIGIPQRANIRKYGIKKVAVKNKISFKFGEIARFIAIYPLARYGNILGFLHSKITTNF